MLSKLNGSKTYIVAAVTVAYAAVSFWSGSMDHNTAMEMVFAALGASGLRHGIATK